MAGTASSAAPESPRTEQREPDCPCQTEPAYQAPSVDWPAAVCYLPLVAATKLLIGSAGGKLLPAAVPAVLAAAAGVAAVAAAAAAAAAVPAAPAEPAAGASAAGVAAVVVEIAAAAAAAASTAQHCGLVWGFGASSPVVVVAVAHAGKSAAAGGWWQWQHRCTGQTCQPCWQSPLHENQMCFAGEDAWTEPDAGAAGAGTFAYASAAAVELLAAAVVVAVAAVAAVVAETVGVAVAPLLLEAAHTAVAVGRLDQSCWPETVEEAVAQ